MSQTNPEPHLSQETDELLRAYFSAFANLYGIIPLYRALRIIQKQNPDLALTEAQFLAFANQIDQEEHFYIIAGAEDIYGDGAPPTPPMKREIIAEYLYAVDDFESYEELREQQGDKPFYVPDREALLKYQDDLYTEETGQARALGDFLREEMGLKRADDILSDLQLAACMGNADVRSVIADVERLAGRGCFSSSAQLSRFFRYYFDLYNHTRLAANRGFTPEELYARTGGAEASCFAFGPNISRMLPTGGRDAGPLPHGMAALDMVDPLGGRALEDLERVRQKKPGRNDPCPCGSGKKYKKCCGR